LHTEKQNAEAKMPSYESEPITQCCDIIAHLHEIVDEKMLSIT